MRSAWDLHKKWENSRLIIASSSGHSMLEEEIQNYLVQYTNKFLKY